MSDAIGSAAAIAGYAARALVLAERYDAISNDLYYASVRHLIPGRPSRVVDIGAGTGRDARWFADMGHSVTAVEPVTAFRDAAQGKDDRIDWVNDALPALKHLMARGGCFDFINLSGVWQHLDPAERRQAAPVFWRIAALPALLLMALRHGPAPEGRPVYPIDADETCALLAGHGVVPVFRRETASLQSENRAAGVNWTWRALRLGKKVKACATR